MRIKGFSTQLRIAEIDTNSLMAAIIVCFSFINGAIGINHISYITISIVWLLFLYGIIKKKIHFAKWALIVPVYILAAFLLSYFAVPDTTYTISYFLYFVGFGVVSFFIGMQEFDIERTERHIELIGFFCVLVFFFILFESYDASLRMGISYSLLPVFLVSLIFILRRQFRLFSFINVLLSIYFYVSIAPRGLWLTIGFFAVLYAFYVLTKAKGQGANRIKQFLVLLLIFGALIYVFNYLSQILTWVNTLCYTITGSRVYAIDKFSYLMSQGNLSNGREELRNYALEIIRNYPITGRGIGFFETKQDGLYVHNVVLQALCEGGLFFFIPLVIMIIRTIVTLLNNKRMQNGIEYTFFLVTTVNGLIILFYSSVYWQLLLFWFLLGYLIKGNHGRGAVDATCII